MAKLDYYETLGIGKQASSEDIKKAYRTQAMKYHPDRNPGDKKSEQKFKDATEAYEVLKDDQKRAAYNRMGHAAFEQGGGQQGGFDFNFSSSFADVFDDLFGEFTGGRRSGGNSGHGGDLRYRFEMSLEEAFAGKQATIRVPTLVACGYCNGSGAKGGTRPTVCSSCGGSGKMRATQGFFTVLRTCSVCRGSGQVITNPCKKCGGSGRARHEKALSVTIPAGVEDGTRIRLAGEGEAGVRGAAPGDLYVFLSVKTHRIFQRDGSNIYCRVPIPMTTASLGGTIEVPAIDGSRARISIPPGTQSGHQFRLKNKGMTMVRGAGRGDMYIQAVVETPVNLNKKQQEILREFERSGGKQTSPESEGFFAKVRELWEDLRE